MRSTLKLHDRLTLAAAAESIQNGSPCAPYFDAARLIRLANKARKQEFQYGTMYPYSGEVDRLYMAWGRVLRLYLRRLLGDELAEFVREKVAESGESPSYIIRYYSKEGH